MRFNVVVSDNLAVITSSDSGRYSSAIEAILSVIKAAHDINIQVIVFEDKTCSIIDSFTGGLKQNSLIVKELTGQVIEDPSLWSRFYSWIKTTVATYRAKEQFDAARAPKDPLSLHKDSLLGGSLSISTRNRLHPYRCGRKS